MQIVVCCNQFPAVSETFVTSQVAGLERRGHRVTVFSETVNRALLAGIPGSEPSGGVFSLLGDEPTSRSGIRPRLRLIAGSMRGLPGFVAGTSRPWRYARPGLRWTGLLAARAYARAAEIGSVDLVHAHMGPTAFWARAIAARHGVPFVVTFHGSDATRYPAEYGWANYRALLDPPPATFIVHSSLIGNLLRAGLGAGSEQVPLGVDTTLFAPQENSRRGKGSRDRVRLVVIGRLVPGKGVRVAIETLALLRHGGEGERLDATLDIVGTGPESEALGILAKAIGVGADCRLHGPQPPAAVAELLREADLLLVPSMTGIDGAQEAFGVVCLEAQACGVPVVGTICGGLPDAVAPPVGGRCVAQHSPFAMASAVRELLGSSNRDSMRADARARVLEVHSEDAYLDGYERAFGIALARATVESSSSYAETPGEERPDIDQGAARVMQGSLPAYVIGREVVEIRRRSSTEHCHWSRMTRGWTTVGCDDESALASLHPGQESTILDLDGSSPALLVAEWRNMSRRIGSGTIAIIAIKGDGSRAEEARTALASDFSEVLLLDRLFTPGYPGEIRAAPSDRPGGSPGEPRPLLRYLLCVA